jgi:hypothetical protein
MGSMAVSIDSLLGFDRRLDFWPESGISPSMQPRPEA